MNLIKYFIFILLRFSSLSKASTPNDIYYYAAVIEYAYKVNGTATEILNYNLNQYLNILNCNIHKNNKVDIIIFPESTLNEADFNEIEIAVAVPDPKKKIILCDNIKSLPAHRFLSELSCWAKDYKKYMVFNVVEIYNNKIYNTNVVFDRKGTLIARYRKFNLFKEPNKEITQSPELTVFETDFGVKFGTFTCVDILFYEPAMTLVKQGIKDFLYPTMWYSRLPYFTANQLQFSWAYSNDVNLLVSGASNPFDGNTGTGVFAGKFGILQAEMNEEPKTNFHVVKVPKKNQTQNFDFKIQLPIYSDLNPFPRRLTGLQLLRDETIELSSSKIIDLGMLDMNEEICHNEFCCDFRIKTRSFYLEAKYSHYTYRIIAYSGRHNYMDLNTKSSCQICAVVACTDYDDITSCGKIFPENETVANYFYFEALEIRTFFKISDKMLIMPTTVDHRLQSLNSNEFVMAVESFYNESYLGMILLQNPNSDLLTFGIYTSYYDSFVKKPNGSRRIRINSLFLVFLLFSLRIYLS